MVGKQKLGEVFSYFSKVGVAAIRLTDGDLNLGDRISIEGATTNVQQTADSIQIDKTPVQVAKRGQSVGIKVTDKVRSGDVVYKITGA